MNGSVSVPVSVPEDISAFFSRDRDFYRDTYKLLITKYKLLITFIHISPHWDSDRNDDRWETMRNYVIIALTVPINVPIKIKVTGTEDLLYFVNETGRFHICMQ